MTKEEAYNGFKEELEKSLYRAEIQLGYLEEKKKKAKNEDEKLGAEQMVTQTKYIIKENKSILKYLDNYKI